MKGQTINYTLYIFAAFTASLLFFTFNAEAASVTGIYRSANSKNAAFAITVGTPAPANIIIQSHHTRGIKIASTSPSASKVNERDGTVKWFLKNIRPGNYTFSVSFADPVKPVDTHLVLRYRDPASGTFQEIHVRP